MELQSIDFSVDDILNMHRQWITSLYVDDGKTDVEIVCILQERCLTVTVTQVRRCIEEWGLIRREIPTASSTQPEMAFEEDWEWISSRQPSPTPSHISCNPSDLDMMNHYAKRPLPSVPTSASLDELIGNGKKRKVAQTDRLGVTRDHEPLQSESHELETTLSQVPDRPTPLETYAEDEQSHEMVALGLDSDQVQLGRHRRAGDSMGSARYPNNTRPRRRQNIHRRKRKVPAPVQEAPVDQRESTSPEL
ncbi:hypothetical protein EG329_006037 [Mollisiaceae sp. DMI_Dod_QoI]|nr:hypothetical protein EG329_006037 [Helotiales sp. DMI_Dod_QoI]